MAVADKERAKEQLEKVLGKISRAARGNSLYFSVEGTTLYIRYSKRHHSERHPVGFYGIRKVDIEFVRDNPKGAVVFVTDDPGDMVFVPIRRMLEILETAQMAQDGSYKCQVYFGSVPEMSISGVGRVGLGAYMGVPLLAPASGERPRIDRQHAVIQSMLRDIGQHSGYDVWVPRPDRSVTVSGKPVGYGCLDALDLAFPQRTRWVVENIDMVWIGKARRTVEALFEVEHSTSIYSGLLRLNDVLIDMPVTTLGIVTDHLRHSTYVKHVARRTFEHSGLSLCCSHYTYDEVVQWHVRTAGR